MWLFQVDGLDIDRMHSPYATTIREPKGRVRQLNYANRLLEIEKRVPMTTGHDAQGPLIKRELN